MRLKSDLPRKDENLYTNENIACIMDGFICGNLSWWFSWWYDRHIDKAGLTWNINPCNLDPGFGEIFDARFIQKIFNYPTQASDRRHWILVVIILTLTHLISFLYQTCNKIRAKYHKTQIYDQNICNTERWATRK